MHEPRAPAHGDVDVLCALACRGAVPILGHCVRAAGHRRYSLSTGRWKKTAMGPVGVGEQGAQLGARAARCGVRRRPAAWCSRRRPCRFWCGDEGETLCCWNAVRGGLGATLPFPGGQLVARGRRHQLAGQDPAQRFESSATKTRGGRHADHRPRGAPTQTAPARGPMLAQTPATGWRSDHVDAGAAASSAASESRSMASKKPPAPGPQGAVHLGPGPGSCGVSTTRGATSPAAIT